MLCISLYVYTHMHCCIGNVHERVEYVTLTDLLVYCVPHVLQDSIWVHVSGYGSVITLRTVPTSYLSCSQQSALRGCLVQFDHLGRQCAEGRIGKWSYRGRGGLSCVCVCVEGLYSNVHGAPCPASCPASHFTPLTVSSSGPMCAACNASAGYGVTMDLRFCTRECSAGGPVLFVLICE